MKFSDDKIIDLSHPLYRRKEHHQYDANAATVSRLIPDNWYIECVSKISGCAGTHLELPYRCEFGGRDCFNYPLQQLLGEAVIIDCTGKDSGERIELADVQKSAGSIREGDMIVLKTGWDKHYREDGWNAGPVLSEQALDWLLGFKPAVIGTDAAELEARDAEGEPVHRRCFAAGVPMLFCLNDLSRISGERTTLIVLPLSMQRMDSSPVRAIAINE